MECNNNFQEITPIEIGTYEYRHPDWPEKVNPVCVIITREKGELTVRSADGWRLCLLEKMPDLPFLLWKKISDKTLKFVSL